MRKLITIPIILASLSSSTWAVNKSLKVHVSNINATSDEIVYNTDGSKLSHLYWRLEDVKLLGITGSVSVNERVIINADYKKNIDNPNSTMDDYDWQSSTRTGWTNWSNHPNTTVKDITKIDINIQLGILPTKIGIVYGIFGYKKDTYKWLASEAGDYIYTCNPTTLEGSGRCDFDDNYFRNTEWSNTGNDPGISYNQYIETTYIGLGLVNTNIPNFKFDINFKYASGVSINDEDTHHQRTGTVTGSAGTYTYDGLYFEDYCDDATMLEYSLSAAYEFPNNLSAYITYVHTDFDIAKGYTKTSYMGTPYYSTSSNGTAGASHESKMYSMGIKYDF